MEKHFQKIFGIDKYILRGHLAWRNSFSEDIKHGEIHSQRTFSMKKYILRRHLSWRNIFQRTFLAWRIIPRGHFS